MKTPQHTDEKYKLSNDFECIKLDFKSYLADITGHIDQIETENKDLTKALEAIRDLTSDEQSPLMKALYEIAHKTLKTK